MRTSAVVMIAIVATAMGYLFGRIGRPDSPVTITPVPSESHQEATSETPVQVSRTNVPVSSPTEDPAEPLLAAFNMPDGAGKRREIRISMNAWLAADGADDPLNRVGDISVYLTV